jgi:hypothetical protein
MGAAVLAQGEAPKMIALSLPAGHRLELHRRVARPSGYTRVNPVAQVHDLGVGDDAKPMGAALSTCVCQDF